MMESFALNYAALGKRIVEYRKGKGMAQEDLALRAGISTATLSHIENGNRKPHIDTIGKIAWVLGVTMDDLFYESFPYARTLHETRVLELFEQCSPQRIKSLYEIMQSVNTIMDTEILNARQEDGE